MSTLVISSGSLRLPRSHHHELRRGLHLLACSSTSINYGDDQSGYPVKEVQHESNMKAGKKGSAPLVDALEANARRDIACFHVPAHNRGRAAPAPLSRLIGLEPFLHDSAELPEMDDLFFPEGPILEAQRLAAELFGSRETRFLVGGSTCGVLAAITGTCSPGDTLILPRNMHISAVSGMILSGARPKYILPEYIPEWDIASGVTPSQVQEAIQEARKDGAAIGAVLIASPTYHGACINLQQIADICHFHGVPLIVDEAHGAHFKFHPQFPRPALEQGADVVIQSTHKVLGSLTQSSMLHISGNLVDINRINGCLRMLQSTSPSYLLLASLDAARAQISANQDSIFNEAVILSHEVKDRLLRIPGITLLDIPSFSPGFREMNPLRITVGVWNLRLSSFEADDILDKEYGVASEVVGRRSITFMINFGICREDVDRLVMGFKHLSKISLVEDQVQQHNPRERSLAPYSDVRIRLTPREAFFAKKEKVHIKDCIGRICGELICPYPPAIPVLFPGEIITETALAYLLELKRLGAMISGAADRELLSIVVCGSLPSLP